jgi:Hen1-like subunit of RNA repair complex
MVLLTLTTTRRPATDLAVLLHQDPDQVRLVTLPFGSGLVCFSQADDARCTAAVMVHSEQRALSLLALALADVFDDALADAWAEDGRRSMPLPVEVEAPLLPCPAGPDPVRRLFEPLGYHVAVTVVPADPRQAGRLDEGVPSVALRLTGLVRVPELLAHLCVLLPVLDGADRSASGMRDVCRGLTVDPLLSHGDPWVHNHPARDAVLARFRAGAPTG